MPAKNYLVCKDRKEILLLQQKRNKTVKLYRYGYSEGKKDW